MTVRQILERIGDFIYNHVLFTIQDTDITLIKILVAIIISSFPCCFRGGSACF